MEALDGRWEMVRAERDGAVANELVALRIELEFSADRYVVRFAGQVADLGQYAVELNSLTLVGTEGPNQGRTIPCLFQRVGSRLRICYGLDGVVPAGFATTAESMLDAGNWEGATRQAHTLKGLCATLGATTVRPLAAGLEQALQAHDMILARQGITEVDVSVTALLIALAAHFAVHDPDGPSRGGVVTSGGTGEGPGTHRAEFSDWLARLREFLRQGDNEARDLWESRQVDILAQLPSELQQRVSKALANFEFDSALRLLPEVPPDHSRN